ncbi:MAG: methyltransferase domain-containing protein [Deltaproteobacteria bacterium]|nr:methyltransferase domain-containing protein [Deltaproteobacteria bacterium]
MPSCSQCKMLVNDECSATAELSQVLGRPAHRIGSCMIPIVDAYLPLVKKGMRVLEVGCGSWPKLKDHCAKVGAHYEGIDTQAEYFGKKTVATKVENLAELSYETDSFDLVIGNQTMEHWAEYGCRVQWGLYQCFRVCKPGGSVFLNIPFFFHGTDYFLFGKEVAIRHLFEPFSSSITLEHWGWPSDPLPPIYTYPNFWAMKDKPAHIVDIRAVKNKPLPTGYHNYWGTSGRVSRVLNKPFSWNLFLVLRRLGVFKHVEPS